MIQDSTIRYYESAPSTVPQYQPAAPAAPAPAPAPAPGGELPGPGANTSYRTSEAYLSVQVPADAKVFVNGLATSSKGDRRQYVSRGLADGYSYTYEVRAEVVRDGRTVEETKTVYVRAGETSQLAFNLQPTSNLETSLTLLVPEDAKVTLAGTETAATGAVRVFSTTNLTNDKEWTDYKVVVSLNRNGETKSKEQTIRLKAGDNKTLSFEFDGAEKVASNR